MYTGDRIDIRYTLLLSEIALYSFAIILIFIASAKNVMVILPFTHHTFIGCELNEFRDGCQP